jgi:hypothetical protein
MQQMTLLQGRRVIRRSNLRNCWTVTAPLYFHPVILLDRGGGGGDGSTAGATASHGGGGFSAGGFGAGVIRTVASVLNVLIAVPCWRAWSLSSLSWRPCQRAAGVAQGAPWDSGLLLLDLQKVKTQVFLLHPRPHCYVWV